jgi:glycosyltransferase involved in cell wall biosynthesis
VSEGPRRIDQVVHVLAARDAIGAHVLHTREVLREAGYASDIYAAQTQPELSAQARPLEELPAVAHSGSWLLFHHSTGAPVADLVARRPEPLVLDYHNVTPAELVAPWVPWLRAELELGAEQLAPLAGRAVFAIAHSRFSERALHEAGCPRTAVAAPLVDLEATEQTVDLGVLGSLTHDKEADGGSDWLFVGRVSPHKAQHDLVKAFACYRRCFDDGARLHLVGGALGTDYQRALERFCARLGIEGAVRLTGSVSPGSLAAYYRAADVFVCASDHEGFCVPLVEAMAAGVPVVAYDAAAVGETVGSGGLVLEDKSPVALATAVHRVLADERTRAALVQAGRRRARDFTLETGAARMAAALSEAVRAGRQLGVA